MKLLRRILRWLDARDDRKRRARAIKQLPQRNKDLCDLVLRLTKSEGKAVALLAKARNELEHRGYPDRAENQVARCAAVLDYAFQEFGDHGLWRRA